MHASRTTSTLTERARNKVLDRVDTTVDDHGDVIDRVLDRVERAYSSGAVAVAFGVCSVATTTYRLVKDPQRIARRIPRRQRIAGVIAGAYTAAVLYGRNDASSDAWTRFARSAELPRVLGTLAGSAATNHLVGAVIGDRDHLDAREAFTLAVAMNVPAVVRHLERDLAED